MPALIDLGADHWASRPISAALEIGLMGLAGRQAFAPGRPCTRAEMARGLALMMTLSPELRQTPLVARLVVKKGTVRLTPPDAKEPRLISNYVYLKEGDALQVAQDGAAEIVFEDGSGIKIESDTELIVKKLNGFAFLSTEGVAKSAVDFLEITLKKGKIFGALASRHDLPEKAQEGEAGQGKTTGKTARWSVPREPGPGQKFPLLAYGGKEFPFLSGLLAQADAGAPLPWWKVPFAKRTRVQVDMPWGVAGVRGSFWMNWVTPEGKEITTVLVGEVLVTVAGRTALVSDGQSLKVTDLQAPLEKPLPMTREELKEWAEVKQWVEERAQEIQQQTEQNLSAEPGTGLLTGGEKPELPGEIPSEEKPVLPKKITDVINKALEKAETATGSAGSAPAGGGGGGGGTGGVSRPAPPVLSSGSPPPGTYSEPQVIELTAQAGAQIYYTLDGSEPTPASRLYSGPITINATTVIKAIAVHNGVASTVATFWYNIEIPGGPSLTMVVPPGKLEVYLPSVSLEGRVEAPAGGAVLQVEVNGLEPRVIPLAEENLAREKQAYFSCQLSELPMGTSEVLFTVRDRLGREQVAYYKINRVPGLIIQEQPAAVYGYASEPEATVSVQVYGRDGVLKGSGQAKAEIDGFFALSELLGNGACLAPGDWLQVKEIETRRMYRVNMANLWQAYLDATREQVGTLKLGPGQEVYLEVQETPAGAWRMPGRLQPGKGEYIYTYSLLTRSGHLSLKPQPVEIQKNEYILTPRVRVVARALTGPAFFALETTRRALDLELDQGRGTLSGNELIPSWQSVWLKLERSGSIIYSGSLPPGHGERYGRGGFTFPLPEGIAIIPGDILTINNQYQVTVPLLEAKVERTGNLLKSVEGYLLVEDKPAAGSPLEITAGTKRILTGVSSTGDFRVDFGDGVPAGEITIRWLSPQWHTVTWRFPG